MCLAVARWREVHCSLFTIRSNTAIRLVPRFSERMQTTAYPSPCIQLSERVHCSRNLRHNSQRCRPGYSLRNRLGEQHVTEVSSVITATYSGAHRCPSVVNRLERSASPIRWDLWTSVSGRRRSSSVISTIAAPSPHRLLGDNSPMLLAGTSSMSSARSRGVDSTLATDILDDRGARHTKIGAARSVSNGWAGRAIFKRARGMDVGDGPAVVDW
jgi:hypothetical protein